MTGVGARAAVGVALVVFTACDAVSFESLGKLPASASGAAAPSTDASLHDAAPPPLLDAGRVTPPPATAAAARDSGAAPSSSGAAGMLAAAGSGGAASAPGAPDELSGSLDSMPLSIRGGYVAGVQDEFQQTGLYFFDSSVSCAQLSNFAWLSQLPSTTHVIEITFPSTAPTGSPVTNASVSYMHGGTYAFSKMRATSSMLVLSHVTQAGPIDGTLTATFGSDMIEGAFHAEYCAGGMGL